MRATTSVNNSPEALGRRGFVRAVMGSGLAALAGVPAARAARPLGPPLPHEVTVQVSDGRRSTQPR